MRENKVIVRDSTLREGIELPGVQLALEDKMQVIRALTSTNVPEVEIGMPYGIRDCLPLAEAVKAERLNIKTSALILSYSQTWREEVELVAASCLDRVEVLFPSSDILLKLKKYYHLKKEELPLFVEETVTYAKQHVKAVGVGFVDATQTEAGFLCRLVAAAQKASADRAIIYDTAGITTPEKYAALVSSIRAETSLPLHAHCHNDFGLATANTVAGILAGTAGADVVVNGLGDRGGNAPLEEVVLALERLYNFSTKIKLDKITGLSNLVEEKIGIRKCLVKPVVGAYTFLHSPVQHIRNAAEGNYQGFEPFAPETIGAQRKYAFTLPVDYTAALEPFFTKLNIKPENTDGIIRELRRKSLNGGLTESQVLEVIVETNKKSNKVHV